VAHNSGSKVNYRLAWKGYGGAQSQVPDAGARVDECASGSAQGHMQLVQHPVTHIGARNMS